MCFQKAMVTSYRVVCSWDPENPKAIYVDFCKDGLYSHDVLFLKQKRFYRNERLEQIFNDSRGIFLRESRDGAINLVYVKHRDVMADLRQKQLRQLVDGEIIRRFKQMKSEGRFQTIDMPIIHSKHVVLKHPPRSFIEERIAEANAREARLKKLKELRALYYQNKQYADRPHILLKAMQARYSGD